MIFHFRRGTYLGDAERDRVPPRDPAARKFLWGWAMICIPVLIIFVGYWMFWPGPERETYNKSAVEIHIDHPPQDFFDRRAQLVLAFGMCLSSIGYGAAKVIRAFKS